MIESEFYFQVNRLKKTFGENQWPDERVISIFQIVKDLDAKWFRNLVTGMIVSMNSRIDISEAARGEKRHRASVEFANDVIRAAENFREQMTDKGYHDALEKFGANSLMEAVENSTKKTERWDQR